jgi:hypothetical protein
VRTGAAKALLSQNCGARVFRTFTGRSFSSLVTTFHNACRISAAANVTSKAHMTPIPERWVDERGVGELARGGASNAKRRATE